MSERIKTDTFRYQINTEACRSVDIRKTQRSVLPQSNRVQIPADNKRGPARDVYISTSRAGPPLPSRQHQDNREMRKVAEEQSPVRGRDSGDIFQCNSPKRRIFPSELCITVQHSDGDPSSTVNIKVVQVRTGSLESQGSAAHSHKAAPFSVDELIPGSTSLTRVNHPGSTGYTRRTSSKHQANRVKHRADECEVTEKVCGHHNQ